MTKKEVTLYYANWCGHCKTFKPAWFDLKKYVEIYKDDIKKKYDIEIVTNEYEESTNPKIMDEKGIKGFPTILIDDKEYEGDRTIQGIIKELIPEITKEDLDKMFPEHQSAGKINDAVLNFLNDLPLLEGGFKRNSNNKSMKTAKYQYKYMKYKTKYLALGK
jgi:glutaredoxin